MTPTLFGPSRASSRDLASIAAHAGVAEGCPLSASGASVTFAPLSYSIFVTTPALNESALLCLQLDSDGLSECVLCMSTQLSPASCGCSVRTRASHP